MRPAKRKCWGPLERAGEKGAEHDTSKAEPSDDTQSAVGSKVVISSCVVVLLVAVIKWTGAPKVLMGGASRTIGKLADWAISLGRLLLRKWF